MAKKQYDPLWEIVGEKVALQGGEPDMEGLCPHCSVKVHLNSDVVSSEWIECGLCGGLCIVVLEGDVPALKRAE